MHIADKLANQCDTFLGVVFEDGLPPYFLRYSINSAVLEFKHAPLFEDPKPKLDEAIRLKLLRKGKIKGDPVIREPFEDEKVGN